MTRLVPFLGRKSTPPAEASAPVPQQPALQPPEPQPQPKALESVSARNEIELDAELFHPLATQLGQENEAIRNLLMDAEHKMSDLENIKHAIAGLIEPVAKTLRSYEEVKNEKLNLQSTLNSTRVTHAKLREEMAGVEKKATTLDAECSRLREMAAVAQQSVTLLERTKAEQLAELNSRRAQIADQQRHLQQQGSELQAVRDENRRITERFTGADKRMVQLEGETQIAQQKAKQAKNEQAAVQAALDKALNDYSQTARKLTEADKAAANAQSRLRTTEASLAEAQNERLRLSAALDEANHKHLEETSQHSSRFEALQARASLTENLLEEARQTLVSRSEDMRALERRLIESSDAQSIADEKLSQASAVLTELEQRIRDFESSHAAMTEHNQSLTSAVSARDAATNRAQQKLKEQEELVQLLEGQLKSTREANALQIEQLNGQVQRERIERAMAEGALESNRKDLARLMRELAAFQQRSTAAAASAAPKLTIGGLKSAA